MKKVIALHRKAVLRSLTALTLLALLLFVCSCSTRDKQETLDDALWYILEKLDKEY